LLIIFDLDDTLVDTSGCITPVKLQRALERMIQAGLYVPDFEEALDSLKAIDRTALSARDSLEAFLTSCCADLSLLAVGIKEVYDTSSEDLSLLPLEGACELLRELSSVHRIALVTRGKLLEQMGKLKKAGIDSGFFSKIIVSEETIKKVHYEALAKAWGYSPEEILVCGDRVAVDLTPASELGFKTVQICWGRGLSSLGFSSDVDYRISSLGELREIVSRLEKGYE